MILAVSFAPLVNVGGGVSVLESVRPPELPALGVPGGKDTERSSVEMLIKDVDGELLVELVEAVVELEDINGGVPVPFWRGHCAGDGVLVIDEAVLLG